MSAFVECPGCGELFPVRNLKGPGPSSKWCSERCRKRQYQRPCSICGKPCGGSDKSIYCTDCGLEHTHVVVRARRLEIDAQILGLRVAGLRDREIAERLGLTVAAVRCRMTRARRRGIAVAPSKFGGPPKAKVSS